MTRLVVSLEIFMIEMQEGLKYRMYKFDDKDIKLLKFISQLNELAERSGDGTCCCFWGYSSIKYDNIKQEFGSCINLAAHVFLYDDTNPIEGPVGMTLYPLVRQVLVTPGHKEIISFYDKIFVQDDGVEPPCLVAYPDMDSDDCIYIEDGAWFFA